MLDDKILIPLCRRLASRFVRQALHLGAPDDVFDELVNVAYVAGKMRGSIEEAHTWIMWELIHCVTMPTRDVKKQYIFSLSDLRRRYIDDAPSASEEIEKRDEMKKAFRLVMRLRHDDIILICLRFGREMSFKDIGGIFNRTGSWASWKITGILDRLRKEMGG